MYGQDGARAVERAVWLAQIADALNEAAGVISRLSNRDNAIETIQLYAEIEALKLEVESLRLRPSPRPRPVFEPEWTNLWSDREASTA